MLSFAFVRACVCVGFTCHGGYIDNDPASLAVFFAHVLQSEIGSLNHWRLHRQSIPESDIWIAKVEK